MRFEGVQIPTDKAYLNSNEAKPNWTAQRTHRKIKYEKIPNKFGKYFVVAAKVFPTERKVKGEGCWLQSRICICIVYTRSWTFRLSVAVESLAKAPEDVTKTFWGPTFWFGANQKQICKW